MRNLAVAVGCLLLVGGISLVVIADQERLESIAAVKAEIVRIERALDESRGREPGARTEAHSPSLAAR